MLKNPLILGYVCVVKTAVNGQWWKVDTAGRSSITRQDPFVSQMGARDRIGFTITFLVFK